MDILPATFISLHEQYHTCYNIVDTGMDIHKMLWSSLRTSSLVGPFQLTRIVIAESRYLL